MICSVSQLGDTNGFVFGMYLRSSRSSPNRALNDAGVAVNTSRKLPARSRSARAIASVKPGSCRWAEVRSKSCGSISQKCNNARVRVCGSTSQFSITYPRRPIVCDKISAELASTVLLQQHHGRDNKTSRSRHRERPEMRWNLAVDATIPRCRCAGQTCCFGTPESFSFL
jgi:hypothetical protein